MNTYYENKKKGMEKRNKKIFENFTKLPSKKIIEESHLLNERNKINEFTINDTICNDQNKINDHIFKVFNEIYRGNVDSSNLDEYCFKIKPIADKKLIEEMNKDFSVKYIFETIDEMDDSSPGPNGLTRLFFKRFLTYFSKYFVQMINNIDKNAPKQFKSSNIKLIPKNNNKIKTINDYRPITITNYEYRIFAKVIVKRLRNFNAFIFDEQQHFSIKGRKIDDIIHMIKDFIHDSIMKGKILKIISIDQKKAFDSIIHAYLFKFLKYVNIGSKLTSIIVNLYNDSVTRLDINDSLLEEIKVKRSIKQGDPLSMWLYILSLQELIISIKIIPSIIGYKINILNNKETKIRAYADDIGGTLLDDNSIRELF